MIRNFTRLLVRQTRKYSAPFQEDLQSSKEEILANDPNLEGFFADSTEPPSKPDAIPIDEPTGDLIGRQFTPDQLQDVYREMDGLGLSSTFLTPKSQIVAHLEAQTPLVVVSKLLDPRMNLSLEKYIYEKMPPSAKRMLFYRNTPCVVIGKNQNPYVEVNLQEASRTGVPILRRISGGGTVVHDLGNSNFSFMTDKSQFSRHNINGKIVDQLKSIGLELSVNDKGDIVSAESGNKVSGSAFKVSKGKSLHHGTMLLNSDLQQLKQLLKKPDIEYREIKTLGTNSIRSPVQNINIDEAVFVELASKAFSDSYSQGLCDALVIEDTTQLPAEVMEDSHNSREWNWVFGGSPRFSLFLSKPELSVELKVVHGRIEEVVVDGDASLRQLLQSMADHKPRFIGHEIRSLLSPATDRETELCDWVTYNVDFNVNYKPLLE